MVVIRVNFVMWVGDVCRKGGTVQYTFLLTEEFFIVVERFLIFKTRGRDAAVGVRWYRWPSTGVVRLCRSMGLANFFMLAACGLSRVSDIVIVISITSSSVLNTIACLYPTFSSSHAGLGGVSIVLVRAGLATVFGTDHSSVSFLFFFTAFSSASNSSCAFPCDTVVWRTTPRLIFPASGICLTATQIDSLTEVLSP